MSGTSNATRNLVTVFVLGAMAAAGETGANAAPFPAGQKAENSNLVIQAKSKPRYSGGNWYNSGRPTFFENCWWQLQKRKGRSGFESRWVKKSCPDLRRRSSQLKRPNVDHLLKR